MPAASPVERREAGGEGRDRVLTLGLWVRSVGQDLIDEQPGVGVFFELKAWGLVRFGRRARMGLRTWFRAVWAAFCWRRGREMSVHGRGFGGAQDANHFAGSWEAATHLLAAALVEGADHRVQLLDGGRHGDKGWARGQGNRRESRVEGGLGGGGGERREERKRSSSSSSSSSLPKRPSFRTSRRSSCTKGRRRGLATAVGRQKRAWAMGERCNEGRGRRGERRVRGIEGWHQNPKQTRADQNPKSKWKAGTRGPQRGRWLSLVG